LGHCLGWISGRSIILCQGLRLGLRTSLCLARSFRGLLPVGLAWLLAVSVMLVVGGRRTPTDVAGGLLIAISATLVAFRHAARRPKQARGA
jgi:hypothetical protein